MPGRRKGDPFRSLPPRSFDSEATTLSQVIGWARSHPDCPKSFIGSGGSGNGGGSGNRGGDGGSETQQPQPLLRVVVRAVGLALNEQDQTNVQTMSKQKQKQKEHDNDFHRSLSDLGFGSSAAVVLTLAPPSSSSSSSSSASSSSADPFANRQHKAASQGEGGKVHTMLSTGVLKANTNKVIMIGVKRKDDGFTTFVR